MHIYFSLLPSATAACASGAGYYACTPTFVKDLEGSSEWTAQFPADPSGPVRILAALGELLIAVREKTLSVYDVTWECLTKTDQSEIGLSKTHQVVVRDLCSRNGQIYYFVTPAGVSSIDSSGTIAEVAQIQKGDAIWVDDNRIYVSKADHRLMVLENGSWSCLTTLPSRATKIRGIEATLCCSLANGDSLFIDLNQLTSNVIKTAQLIDRGNQFYYLKLPKNVALCTLKGEVRSLNCVREGIGCVKPDGTLCWIETTSEREPPRDMNPIYSSEDPSQSVLAGYLDW